jgi:hypothetical protein
LLLKNLKIYKTPKTPQVNFNQTDGVLFISGVSVPENSMEFYGTLIKWGSEYIKSPAKTTILTFKLSYINTSSLQFIYDLLMLLDSINGKTSKVNIEWYYLNEDEDMKEMGEDFKDAVNLNFTSFNVETIE